MVPRATPRARIQGLAGCGAGLGLGAGSPPSTPESRDAGHVSVRRKATENSAMGCAAMKARPRTADKDHRTSAAFMASHDWLPLSPCRSIRTTSPLKIDLNGFTSRSSARISSWDKPLVMIPSHSVAR